MSLGKPNPTLIHQGPGWLYLNVCAPAPTKRHLIAADGTPTQPAWSTSQTWVAGQMIVDINGNVQECTTGGAGKTTGSPTWVSVVGTTTADASAVWTCVALAPAYEFAGALEGVTEVNLAPKLEAIQADQETLPVDVVMTGEAESISVTLKESDAVRLGLTVPHATYASGTDTGLPAGAQDYEEIAFGGLPPAGIAKYGVLFISKRKDQAAKFIVTQLYRAYQKDSVKLPFQRGKETTYKIEFDCIADVNRPAGHRGGKLYRQT